MDKSLLLDQLRAAKSAHIQWRARAQALVNGLALEEGAVPVLHTDCKFGKWYYGAGQALSHIHVFRDIDEAHERLHMIYMEIFKTLFSEDDRSMLSKWFGSARKHEEAKLEKAKQLLPALNGVSKNLLSLIEILEQQVRAMSDEDLAKVL